MNRDTRTLARLATGIENEDPEALQSLAEADPGTGLLIGITGPPGAGKSTLVDVMARALRQQQKTVAIIAVDPSSRATGGAILGDRIRMQDHHADPGIFIRSMATRGSLGGLARATGNMARLFRSSGFDSVVIETVGVGQDEIEIAALADVTVVVLVPGMGDDVQAIKAGIMEIADIFVINKSDQPGADRTEREIRSMLTLAHRHGEPMPPILHTSATENAGIAELIAAIQLFPRRERAKPPAQFGIDHLGIAVPSLDEALRFYSGQLAMPVTGRETVAHEKVNVAMLPASGPRIELIEPSDPDSVVARFLEKRGPGLHHLALRVPDLAGTVAELKSSGAKLLNEPRRGAGGHLYVFVHPASTGGVLLELIQQ